MKKLSKVLFVLALALIVVLPLSAAKAMNVTWQWLLNDSFVTQYRYQIDGENEESWTVVDGNTDSYTALGLDPYTDYTLYLQCTYDGVNWSESATSVAYALLEKEVEPEVVVTPPEVVAELEPEVVPALEEPAPVVVLPETASFDVYGYTVDNSWIDGKLTSKVSISGIVTTDDIRGFAQYEIGKYGAFLLDNTTIEFINDGFILSYPEGVNPADYLNAYKSDIEEYIGVLFAPKAEEVVVEAEAEPEVVDEPVVDVPLYSTIIATHGLSANVVAYSDHAVITLPEGTTEGDVKAVAKMLLDAYPEAQYVQYTLDGNTLTLTYPEQNEAFIALAVTELRNQAMILADQVFGKVESAVAAAPVEPKAEEVEPAPVEEPAPVAEAPEEVKPVEVQPVAPEVEVAPAKKEKTAYSDFNFKLGINLGAEFGFSDLFNQGFTKPTILPRAGLTLDFQNIIPIGPVFGFGTRIDVSGVFAPLGRTFEGKTFMDLLDVYKWSFDATADMKAMIYTNFKNFQIYVGGGIGYSVASAGLYRDTHSNENPLFGCDTALVATAVAGFDIKMGKVFSLSLEANGRYFLSQPEVPAQTLSATVGFNFNF